MSEPSGKSGAPIVEHKPNEIEPSALSLALERRIRQQEILAELGVSALRGASFNQLLDDAARMAAEGVQAEFSKVLDHIPTEKRFLVRAGVGWSRASLVWRPSGMTLHRLPALPCALASRSSPTNSRTRSDSEPPSYS